MAGHGGRLPSVVNGQSSDHGFVLPLSSNGLNGWRRIFTSLTPFVSRTSGRTLRVYARRLLTESENVNGNRPISIPPVGDRHHQLMGSWSTEGVHLGRRLDASTINDNQDNFSSVHSQENENVVINIESNSPREQHRRSLSPSNEESLVLQNSSADSSSPAPSNSDAENPIVENDDQAEAAHRLSINGESITDVLERYPELPNILKVIWQYCIFLLIILAKIVYDKFASLLVVILFISGFIISNKVVKLSVSHQERRPKSLMMTHFLIIASIPLGIYIFYNKAPTNLYYSAMLLPSETNFLSLGELLWIIIITDFVLKLCTVFVKGVYATIPQFIINYKYRGKHLAMIEYTSQLYRSLAPVQPWISYLLDDYTGIQKVFGVFLSALYMLCKGPDIIFRVKNFHYVLKKFLGNSKYGSIPSKTQLKDLGNICPICQDGFVLPTMLECKHIFCEQCVATWFDRERTCPMCRAKVADDPSYRDGSTTLALQLY